MKTYYELVNEVKQRVREVTPDEVMAMQRRGEPAVLLDVRDQPEVNLGKIPGAVHISRGTMEGKVEAVIPREAHVIIYCASGNRSAFAAETLGQMGYQDVASMKGGIRGWVEAGGDVE